jgi:hypothetical protein
LTLTHTSGGYRRYAITGAGQTPIPGAASRYYATGMGLQAKATEGKKGNEVLIASARAAIEAVSQNGLALQHAPPEVRGDKEVVLAAVRQSGGALQYASKDLRGDLDVVREAVKFSATNLRFAAAAIRADTELVMDLLSVTQPCTKTVRKAVAKSVTKPSRVSLQLIGAKRFEEGKGGEPTVPAVLVSAEDYECLRKEYCEKGRGGGERERRGERGRQGNGAGWRREAVRGGGDMGVILEDGDDGSGGGEKLGGGGGGVVRAETERAETERLRQMGFLPPSPPGFLPPSPPPDLIPYPPTSKGRAQGAGEEEVEEEGGGEICRAMELVDEWGGGGGFALGGVPTKFILLKRGMSLPGGRRMYGCLVRVYAQGTRADLCAYQPDTWVRVEDLRRAFLVYCAAQGRKYSGMRKCQKRPNT